MVTNENKRPLKSKRELSCARLNDFHSSFDKEKGLMWGLLKSSGNHPTRINAAYAEFIFNMKDEEHYKRAEDIIWKLCAIQDKNPESKTYGLWPPNFEDKLSEIGFPDFNFADFIGRALIAVYKKHSSLLDDDLNKEIKNSLLLAAKCSMRRHVGLDYTNVILMSCFTIVAVGEITKNNEVFEFGRAELKRLLEYTRFCGAFTEYNSPEYMLVASGAISDMLTYFEDEECIKIANELNGYLWETGARQYSNEFLEYTPPYIRNYTDLDSRGVYKYFIYGATAGKFGEFTEGRGAGGEVCCPEEYHHLFNEHGFYKKTYYRKNNLRNKDEDVAIVQDFESPDLIAYSYKTDKLLFGSFQKSDLWGQRRTLMAIWNKENKRCLKLCALKDGEDFSSAMSYVSQKENKAVVLLGFSNDHGDKHYIVDPLKDGKIRAKKLSFMLKTGGEKEKLAFSYENGEYVLSDGTTTIRVNVSDFYFDGKKAEVKIVPEGLEFVCLDKETEEEIDLTALKKSYAVFSIAVNEKPPAIRSEEKDGRILVFADGGAEIKGYITPQKYNECIRNTIVCDFA